MIDIARIPKDHDEGVIDVTPMPPTTVLQSEARKLRNRRPADLAVGILGSPHAGGCGLNPNLASGHHGTKRAAYGSHPTTRAECSESFETA